MASQRKQSPSTLTGLSPNPSNMRLHTPLPESRERPTQNGLDARTVGTAEIVLAERTTLASDLAGERADETLLPSSPASREMPTQPAAAAENEELILEPTQSIGYYSLRGSQLDAVKIPRAPRVPVLDLDSLGPTPPSPRVRSSSAAYERYAYSTDSEQVQSRESNHPETVRTPPPHLEDDRLKNRRRSSSPPPPMQETPTLEPPPAASRAQRRSSYPTPAPRVYFAPHVRAQANQWAESGSLSLPGCSSPRHARALQRALLLSLLHEPGWYALPQGLQQRAGWLFCDGWESGTDGGHAFREIDDLATVLGLPSGAEARRMLSLAVAGVVPEQLSSRSSTSSRPPPARR